MSPLQQLAVRVLVNANIVFLLLFMLSACDGGSGSGDDGGSGGATPEEFLTQARAKRDAGDLRSAVIYYKNALQAEARNAEARQELGELYVALDDSQSALKELERAERMGDFGPQFSLDVAHALLLQGEIEKALEKLDSIDAGPHLGQLLALRGHAYLSLGKLGQAIAAYGGALKEDPEAVEAHLGLARIARGRGDIAEALSHTDQALAIAPHYTQALLLKGALSLKEDNIEAAKNAFEAALQLNPVHADAMLGLAQALLLEGNTPEADVYLEQLAPGNDQNLQINWALAVSAHQKGDLPGALVLLHQILEAEPGFLLALRMKAQIHYALREFGEAQELLARYLKVVPGDIEAAKLMAGIQLVLKQPDRAVLTLLKVASKAPDDTRLLAILGTAFLQSGDLEQATHYFEMAAALDPEAVATRNQLDLLRILTLTRNGAYEEARAEADDLAKRFPDNPATFILKGSAWAAQGDLVKTREQYEMALSLAPSDGLSLLRLAQLDLRTGDKKAARHHLEAVPEGASTYVYALTLRARFEAEEGRAIEGITLLEQANAIDPGAVLSRIMLTGLYALQGRAEEALMVAEEVYKLAPDQPTVVLVVARARLEAGKPQEALAVLMSLANSHPNFRDVHFELARTHTATGNLREARQSLLRVLELDPRHLAAKNALGSLSLRVGNSTEALEIARQLRTEHPGSAAGIVLEGDVYLATGKTPQAIAAYRKALTLAPSGALVLKIYKAQRSLDKAGEALATLNDWLATHPDDAAVQRALAFSYTERGDTHAAIQAYEHTLTLRPDDPTALNDLAWLYHEQGDPRALALAERAYARAPWATDVLDTYGWLLVSEGNIEQGLKLLRDAAKKAPERTDIGRHVLAARATASGNTRVLAAIEQLDKRPRDPRANNDLGLALAADGQHAEAIAAFETALQFDPALAEAHANIGNALASERNYAEALKRYQAALALDAGLVSAHFGLGEVMLANRRPEEAMKHFLAAIKSDPYSAEAHQRLGTLLEAQGSINEASRHYAEALRLNMAKKNAN